ncbi:mitochondrial fission process protein 1 [Willisornis vidua]|uniref:Mitochondrial fission process protein 1 n=1 Tax=Willisornis vidua TaxID=1566151 RepID=A0ABQ9DUC7_9PASS|nr:mitochondrial fission process protein 1 [Willisornis vidua]
MYTNTHSVGTKEKELEAVMQQESCDVVVIMEMWWDDWRDWSAARCGQMLFRKDRRCGRGGEGALYVRKSLDSVELEVSDNRVESLWVIIRAKAKKADVLVGICYRPPNQKEEGDDLFYKQLMDVSKLPALVLLDDFSLLDVC